MRADDIVESVFEVGGQVGAEAEVSWSRSEQAVVALAVVAALAGSAVLAVMRRPTAPVRIIEPPQVAEMLVHVAGEVVRPGVYRLAAGARVADAVAAAGGTTPLADARVMNLARLLRDGEQVVVGTRQPASSAAGGHPINLNAADARTLEMLPGIGPVLARRIADYRARHGPFQRLEDLLQIDGVGPKLLERLRPAAVIQ